MKNKNLIAVGFALAVAASVAVPAFAEDSVNVGANAGLRMGARMEIRKDIKNDLKMMRPELVGKVTAVNGNILTVSGRGFGRENATTSFSVDASAAVVVKGNATSTVSSISVGDTILVQGTVSGSTITAKKIFDGQFMQKMGDRMEKRASSTAMIEGNGQPIVAGTVTAVGGNTITITNSSNVSFTIDATNAKIAAKGVANATVSNIAVGDHVVAQGTVNGSAVVASSVIDQTKAGDENNGNGDNGNHFGFFRGVGNFFKHLFGF
ncbi:MAG: hypothetical protein V4438_03940 [Patescibacteria group bacterium]